MKSNIYMSLLIALITVLLFSEKSFSQNTHSNNQLNLTPLQIDNLIQGVKSGNDGLCNSAIYLVGRYRLQKATNALVNVLLDKGKSRWTRIYAALALHEVADNRSINDIKKVSLVEDDLIVKNICAAIYLDFLDRFPFASK